MRHVKLAGLGGARALAGMRNVSSVLLLFLALTAGAKPILEGKPSPISEADVAGLAPPSSVFHDGESADARADDMLRQWSAVAVTVPWTRLQLDLHIKHKTSPTRAARGLALTHVAMHDAYEQAVAAHVSVKLAVSMAAARVLGYLYVAEERGFERIVFSLAAKEASTARDKLPADARRAILLGKSVGDLAIKHAEADGAQRGWNGSRLQWYGQGRYYGPGSWEPTPPYFFYPPDEPFAPTWHPWLLTAASQFRPTPPLFGSARFTKDLKELVKTNQDLTPEQLKIAKFWVDGSGSVTPPGHWNKIAIDEAIAAKLDDRTAAKLFAELNVALADTFIATWDVKYFYWTVRPITAAKKVLGIDLKLPILTPPFPSYVSGHGAFSGASARILGHFFPLHAEKLNAMAEEAALSRMYGGIHFRYDNEDGLALGRAVANLVLSQTDRW